MKLNVLNNAILEADFNLFENKEYLIGRDRNSDIVLSNSQISRKHARLFFKDGSWQIELLSKTGSLKKNGLDVNLASITDKDSLQLASYTLSFSDSLQKTSLEKENRQSEENDDDVGAAIGDEAEFSLSQEMGEDEELEFDASSNYGGAEGNFGEQSQDYADEIESADELSFTQNNDSSTPSEEDFLDETTAGGNVQLVNQLRIVYPKRQEEMIKIIGNFWTLGRSDNCDVRLKDSKASRKHIVIKNIRGDFRLKDLGSSNGTFLNGNQIDSEKDYPIISGDCIEIGTTKIYFEQKDARFEDEVGRLPVQVHHHAMINIGDQQVSINDSLPMNINKKPGELGFVKPGHMQAGGKKKNNKAMFYIVIAILGAVSYMGLQDQKEAEKGKTEKASTQANRALSPYEQLSPEQKQFVQSAYSNAYRFFTAEQWDLAISELQKVHRFLPKGHADPSFPDALPSMQMLNIAETAAATLRDQARLEDEKRQKAAFQLRLEESLRDCESKAASMTLNQARTCLEFTFMHSPDNPRGMAIIKQIEDRNKRRVLAAQQESQRQALVAKGEKLYQEAKSVDSKGDVLEAIEAYQAHIDSSYPDPNSLKEQSRNRITAIRGNISSEVEKLRMQMQNYFESDDQLKEAVQFADKILKLDPDNAEATDKRAMAITRLNAKLREEYQDSIFKEAHGDIERAKKIWRRILTLDIVGGEYYSKAKIKLKKHGE